MNLKRIKIAIETEDRHVTVTIDDIDQISDEIHANASSDKLAHAIAGIIDFAGDAAKVYDDAYGLEIDSENVKHLSAHPKAKAKAVAKKKSRS